jgi:hypothetical protein
VSRKLYLKRSRQARACASRWLARAPALFLLGGEWIGGSGARIGNQAGISELGGQPGDRSQV